MEGGGLERLAYELSTRLLGEQESALDEIRARTGTLLAASALVASFLGAEAIQRAGLSVLTALALVAFVVSMLASIYVLLPKSGLVFSWRGSVLFEARFTEANEIADTYRRLAYWVEDLHDTNQPAVGRIAAAYRVAAFALVPEVLLWTVELLR